MKKMIVILACILCMLSLAACSGKDTSTEAQQSATGENVNETEESTPSTESSVSETMRERAGDYELRYYDNYAGIYYDYEALENQRIVNGKPSGTLKLNEDGTGHLSYLDREADISWDESSFLMDGAECEHRFVYQTLYIDTPDNERIEYCKSSHLDEWNQMNLEYERREVVNAGDYALGDPEMTRFSEGKRNYILIRVPIENKSNRNMVLDRLYFTTCKPDGTELAFYNLPANGLDVLLPGEKGEFIFNYFVRDEIDHVFGQINAFAFPEDVVLRVDEVDAFFWTGPYKRYEAEITEVVSFVDTITGSYMVYRPNGYVELPEGTDIQELYIHIYCYDKDGSIIGLGGQFACEESVNPVNYFEEIPGEHRARFQTNMNGPYSELDYPKDNIGHYQVIVNSPEYFY